MKRILGALVIVLFLTMNSQAALIAEYQFNSSPAPSSPATVVHADVTASDFIDSDLVLNYNNTVGDPTAPSVFKTYAELSTDTAGNFAPFTEPFYEFTVLADFGMQMDLSSLSFSAQKTVGPPDGSAYFYVRSDIGGFTTNTGTFQLTDSNITTFVLNFLPLGPAFQNRPTVTFQIYSFDGGDGSANEVRIDDVQLDGIVEVVPEPASMVVWSLLGAAGLGLSYFRRRRITE